MIAGLNVCEQPDKIKGESNSRLVIVPWPDSFKENDNEAWAPGFTLCELPVTVLKVTAALTITSDKIVAITTNVSNFDFIWYHFVVITPF